MPRQKKPRGRPPKYPMSEPFSRIPKDNRPRQKHRGLSRSRRDAVPTNPERNQNISH